MMPAAQFGQRVQALVPLLARDMGINRRGVHQFAGGVHHRDFNPGAQSGVQTQRGPGAGGRGQQQIAQVAGEHPDRLLLGGFAHALLQFGLQMRQQLDLPGPARGFPQPAVGRSPFVANAEPDGDPPLAGIGSGGFGIADFQRHLQYSFVATPEQRQGAMGGNLSECFPVIEVIAKLGAFLGLTLDQLRMQHRVVPQILA